MLSLIGYVSDERYVAVPDAVLEFVSATGESFDLILMLDVLEHLREPTDLVRTAAARLSERGYLVATTPAFQSLWTSHDVLNHHVKRYTAAGLRETIAAGAGHPFSGEPLASA